MTQLPSPLYVDVDLIEYAQGELLVEERALLDGATVVRRREIVAGRVLGHRLMERGGYSIRPIMQHMSGAPLWPTGLCGSIAHSADTVAVTLAPLSSARSLGIDIEDGRDLGDALSEVADDDEIRSVIESGLVGEASSAGRLVFSAKEAVFKCQAPITGNHDLTFGQIRLTPDVHGGLQAVPSASLDPGIADVVRGVRTNLLQLQGVTVLIAWLGFAEEFV